MKSRLEMIARKQGYSFIFWIIMILLMEQQLIFPPHTHYASPRMGFHTTEATCYLTADLFYLEVVLLPCGGLEDVKVAQHGGSPIVRRACAVHINPSLHLCDN